MKINDKTTDWFTTRSGVRQDCLSPTLFSLFLNDLFNELNTLNKGVQVGDDNITVLAYADDIAIITENKQDIQIILNTLENWCKKWRVTINCGKTKVVHFRKKRIPRSCVQFHIGENIIEYAEYKYLGVVLDEFLNFENTANVMALSASRALGAIIGKFSDIKNMGFETFTQLFERCVTPIMEYGSSCRGFKQFSKCDNVQNRAFRFFLGVQRFTPIPFLYSEMLWQCTSYRQ